MWPARSYPKVHCTLQSLEKIREKFVRRTSYSPLATGRSRGSRKIPERQVMLFMYCEWQEMLLAMLVVGISDFCKKIPDISYEDDVKDIPYPFNDDTSVLNGNREPLSFDSMVDAEFERRLKIIIPLLGSYVPLVLEGESKATFNQS
ncbi:hypothetical protein SLE2022_261950 [Rubroshorea leprosula]